MKRIIPILLMLALTPLAHGAAKSNATNHTAINVWATDGNSSKTMTLPWFLAVDARPTSVTTASDIANWTTAYTDRLKWDGGATGLTAATGRTSLELGTLALQNANAVNITGGNAALTSATLGIANVDNVRLDGNTLSSTNTNGAIGLVPNGSGGVGVATVAPGAGYLFDVAKATSGAETAARVANLVDAAGTKASLTLATGGGWVSAMTMTNGAGGAGAAGALEFSAPASGRFLFNRKVGILTQAVVNALDVEGGMAVGATYSGSNTAPTNGMIVEGNVSIGKLSNAYTLDVAGTGRFQNLVLDNLGSIQRGDYWTSTTVRYDTAGGSTYPVACATVGANYIVDDVYVQVVAATNGTSYELSVGDGTGAELFVVGFEPTGAAFVRGGAAWGTALPEGKLYDGADTVDAFYSGSSDDSQFVGVVHVHVKRAN